jgi:hypothetical protein
MKSENRFRLSLIFFLVFAHTTCAYGAAKRQITFPSDQSYGTILDLGPNWNVSDKHPKGKFFAEAKGTISCNADDSLMLMARFPLTDKPTLLNSFPVNSFEYIIIDNLPAEDKIFGPLSRLTGLKRLDFIEGEFHDTAFGQLSKLVNLEALVVRECFVTGESLTHFGSLKKLKYIFFKSIALDWKLLSKSGPTLPGMTDLILGSTNLTDQGLDWIVRMPNLTNLTLDGDVSVTDKGLLRLKSLKKLRRLGLKRMKVTANGLLQLKDTNIKNIQIEDIEFSPSDLKRLTTAMPGIAFAFRKKEMKPDTMEMFAPLH